MHDENGNPVQATITLGMPDKTEKKRQTDKQGNYQFTSLKNGNYIVTIDSKNYETKIIEFDRNDSKRIIELKETEDKTVNKDIPPQPFSLTGWSAWGGITASSTPNKTNTITLNGNVQTAGYGNEWIDTVMAGRTLILNITNSGNSTFNNRRMFKLVYNPEDKLLKPNDIPSLIESEYIPSADSRLTFTIPQDFSGKLQFVFYRATLNDLTISAWYE